MSRKVDVSDIPILTQRPPNSGTVRRAKTLTRPERSVAPVPLITPQNAPLTGVTAAAPSDSGSDLDAWRIFSRIVTFWAPGVLLSSIGGLKDKQMQQAWREKIALCFIIAILCTVVGFLTVGFQKVLCPESAQTTGRFSRIGTRPNTLGVQGFLFDVKKIPEVPGVDIQTLLKSPGQDITPYFQRDQAQYPACKGFSFRAAAENPCATNACVLSSLNPTSLNNLGFANTSFVVGYDWGDVAKTPNYFVLDGAVLNMQSYMALHPTPIPSDFVDAAIRTVLQKTPSGSGKDGTRLFVFHPETQAAIPCLIQRYYAGNIDKITPGCFVSQLILYAGLIVILSLVIVRFVMACVFNWFLSARLAGPPDAMSLNRSAISPAVMPEGANVSIDNPSGTAPWAGPGGSKKLAKASKSARSLASSHSTLVPSEGPAPIMSLAQIGAELFAVCLVTCYSEGEESLRTTLDSISTTTYSDARKLLFVVADGMITGAGEKRSTPDTCVSLLEADPRFGNPVPMSYGAVGAGAKAENRAMVYAGHYSKLPPVPILLHGAKSL
jgi:chitin synthase